MIPVTDNTNVLLVTVDSETNPYEEGLEAIKQLTADESTDHPATVRFPDESQLTNVFNERTYTLLFVIRHEEPESIRETAPLVERNKRTSIKIWVVRNTLTSSEGGATGFARRTVRERGRSYDR